MIHSKKSIFILIISATILSSILVVPAISSTSAQSESETKYKAKLIGDSVVPAVQTTAAGRAVIFVSDDTLRWKLNVTGITDPTMAHIHMGKKGVNGSIVADLLVSGKVESEPDRTILSGKISSADLQGPLQGKTLEDLKSAFNTENMYIDLHTKSHPDGELRGTIRIQGGNETSSTSESSDASDSSNSVGSAPSTIFTG